jgi:hypothetical protein
MSKSNDGVFVFQRNSQLKQFSPFITASSIMCGFAILSASNPQSCWESATILRYGTDISYYQDPLYTECTTAAVFACAASVCFLLVIILGVSLSSSLSVARKLFPPQLKVLSNTLLILFIVGVLFFLEYIFLRAYVFFRDENNNWMGGLFVYTIIIHIGIISICFLIFYPMRSFTYVEIKEWNGIQHPIEQGC